MTSSSRLRAIGSILVLLVASIASVAALLVTRPHLTGSPSAWSGDEVAIGTAWIVAVTCAAWLAITVAACLGAMARGQATTALRIAAFAPPVARRMLQAALVTSAVLLPTSAYAAPPPAPLVLHVGAGGRLMTEPEAPAADEVPVVRAPPTTSTSTTFVASTTTTAPESVPTPTPFSSPRTTAPTASAERPAPAPPILSAVDRTYVVRVDDNLWRIASAHVSRAGHAASDETIARYWQRIIAANRTTLRSGDPSLIFPGEVIALPLD